MSNVRLSNGSPTLERTDNARVADHPKPSACRSLFGPVDRDELRRDFKGHLREVAESAAARWSFDFAGHTPLANGDGRFEWEAVDCTDVPDFYTRRPRAARGVRSSGNNTVDLNGNHSCGAPGNQEDRERECREQCSGPRKRPACHDPSAQNKRSHTNSDEVRCLNLSHSAELTPRKSSPQRQT